ncbi:MAG: hypothetical protein HDT29_01170, partial [Clostridiales bacterium]|nr:hypothetical protein [Clostridiales bacterium]
MEIKKKKLKGYIALSILIIVCMLIASAMTFFMPNKNAEAIKIENMNSQATDLGNLLLNGYENDATGTGYVFNGDVFWKLVEKVTDSANYNKNNIGTLSAVKTSADFRRKNNNKDIVVTIGGKQWVATYLSTNTNGDPILTFWLANNATTSTWSSGSNNSENYWGKQYTSNLYGTSYMRAFLNNSDVDASGKRTGKCEYAATNTSTSSAQNGTMATQTQSTTGDWAIYTAPNTTTGMKGSLVDFIEVPKNMSWQLNQTAIGTVTSSAYTGSYNFNNNNDALSAGGNGTKGDYLSQLTTAGLGTYYSKWGTDTLWLPSVTETGVSGEEGIWKASNNTRANSTNSWLR